MASGQAPWAGHRLNGDRQRSSAGTRNGPSDWRVPTLIRQLGKRLWEGTRQIGGHYRVGLIRGYTKDERARNEFLMVSLSLMGNQRVEKTSAPPLT